MERPPTHYTAGLLVFAALVAAIALSGCTPETKRGNAPVDDHGRDDSVGNLGNSPLTGRDTLRATAQTELGVIGDRVLFDYDRADIRPTYLPLIKGAAAWLQKYGNITVTVEGHSDERGTREYNLALGNRRAESLRAALVGAGAPAARISTVSYGKERPAVVGGSEAAWAQNRRAVIVID